MKGSEERYRGVYLGSAIVAHHGIALEPEKRHTEVRSHGRPVGGDLEDGIVLGNTDATFGAHRYIGQDRAPGGARDASPTTHLPAHIRGTLALRAYFKTFIVANTTADSAYARKHQSPWMLTDVARGYRVLIRSFVVEDIGDAGGSFVRAEGTPALRTQYLPSKHSFSRRVLSLVRHRRTSTCLFSDLIGL